MRGRFLALISLSQLPITVVLFLLLSCAEVAPPPGGEVDKYPPFVIKVEPADGSTNVSPGKNIVFWFSEGITRPAGTKPVFITPRPAKDPELKWKSDKLIVELNESFAVNQTYVVSLTSDIADWRGNKLDSSVTVAFSTGATIDSGSISGIVFKNDKPQRGLLVGLYDLSSNAEEIAFDSVYPAYLTKTDLDGSFRFRYLPEREYRLVSFNDINRDEMFNPNREPFAVPDRNVTVGGKISLKNLFLELTEKDVDTPQVISAVYTSDHLFKIRFTSEISLKYLKQNPKQIKLTSDADTNKVYTARSFQESHLSKTTTLTVLSDMLDSGSYTASIIIEEGSVPIIYEGLTVTSLADKNPPSIVHFTPENKPYFLNEIEIAASFSEPINRANLTEQSFVLTNDQGNVVKMESQWQDEFHLLFKPAGLQEGVSYTLMISQFEIADSVGNLLGDSILEQKFTVLDSDSLGSLSGVVRIELPGKGTGSKQLTFTKIKSKQSYDHEVTDSVFAIQLPAGKYLLSGFIDEDDDGVRGRGSAVPFSFAETFVMKPDTISVRARFEMAGIEFIFK